MDTDKAQQIVASFQTLLDQTPFEAANVRLARKTWTLAEIVGHLVDSASNNHQRFARLRLGDLDDFPGYDAESWVAAQRYNDCSFSHLTSLWTHYNKLLLHLATTTPPRALTHVWRTPDGDKSLDFLLTDYYDHMGMHVGHFATRLAEVTTALKDMPPPA